MLPSSRIAHAIAAGFGKAIVATSITRFEVVIIANFAGVQDTVAADFTQAAAAAPVAGSNIGIVTLFSSIDDTIAAKLGDASIAAAIAGCFPSVVALLTQVSVDEAIAAVLGQTLLVAAVTCTFVAIITYLSLIHEAVATIYEQAKIVTAIPGGRLGAGVAELPEFRIYASVSAVFGKAFITTAVSGHAIAVIADLAHIDHTIPASFHPALLATVISCNDVAVVAGLPLKRFNGPVSARGHDAHILVGGTLATRRALPSLGA